MASAANSSLRNWSEPTAVLGESEDVSVGTLTPPPPHVGSVYDCEPTLNDQQVFEFCRNGYMILEGVVEDAVNRRMMAFVEAHPEHQPLQVLSEDWFVDGVIKNQQAAGAVRSLLGPNFKLPQTLCNHRAECPAPAQGWHRDGGSIYTPRLDYLQVFYYPQDTPKESGPTDVIPGSHFMRSKANYMGHIRSVKLAESTAAPAGSIFITVYSIWHRKSKSTTTGFRNLFKYNYWRTSQPCRDWIIDPDFDFSWPTFNNNPHFEQFKCGIVAAEMFCWLSGEVYEHTGGQCWPCEAPFKLPFDQEGLPRGLRRYSDSTH